MKKNGSKILFFTLIFLALIVSGCGAKKSADQSEKINVNEIKDQQVKEMVQAFKPEEPYQETSADKIQAALSQGKITEEQSIIYQVIVLSDQTKLPQEFQGASVSGDDAYLFGLINEKWDSFSQSTKDALLPYLLPPDDPKSFYNPSLNTDEEKNIWDKILSIKPAGAATPTVWVESKPLPQVSVYYDKSREQQDYQNNVWAQTAAVDSVPKFSDLLGIDLTDKKINIYLNSRGLSGYGQASLNPVSNKICVVRVKTGLNEKMTKATVAHEAFHCYQFFYGFKYELDMKWLMEATATWAEDFVYHNYNTEHEYDSDFFNHTNWDLTSTKGAHEYGSYLWFYYLTEKAGGGAQDIALALAKAKQTNAARQALKSRPAFNDEFKEFSFWNWNQVPFINHTDSPQFPAITPGGNSIKTIPLQSAGDKTEPVSLERGGAKYYFYYLANDNIKKLTFDVKAFEPNENGPKGLQALVKIGDNWYYEDWSNLQERTFCRDLDDENITAAVLITTNSDIINTASGNLKVKAEKKCGPGWIGTVRVSWQGEYQDYGKASGNVKTGGSYSIHEELEYDPEDDELLVKKHNFTFNEKYNKTYQGGRGGCGVIFDNSRSTASGNGNYVYDLKNEEQQSARIYGKTHAEDLTGKIGGQYEIGFDIKPDPNPATAERQFKTTSYWQYLEKNCSFILPLQNAWGGYQESSETKYSASHPYAPNSIEIIIKPDDRTIKGQATYQPGDNIKGTIDWEYRKMD
ncbi:MAG: hypothetical protein WC518_04215 [Patescibacteria group bacterium]